MGYKKIIKGFPNYAITKGGKIWSYKSQKFLKPPMTNEGYKQVSLCKDKKIFRKLVHRLVLETYVGFCPKGMEACHNNGNNQDNELENLRWDTRQNNIRDSIKHGALSCGEKHCFSKLTEQDVRMIIYMCSTGLFTQREVANIYSIHQVHVSRIILRKAWKHIWR